MAHIERLGIGSLCLEVGRVTPDVQIGIPPPLDPLPLEDNRCLSLSHGFSLISATLADICDLQAIYHVVRLRNLFR